MCGAIFIKSKDIADFKNDLNKIFLKNSNKYYFDPFIKFFKNIKQNVL